MKSLAMSSRLAAAGLLLAALIARVAPTFGQPPPVLRPPLSDSTNTWFAPLSAAPVIILGGKTETSQPLNPGVYQIRPCAIILVVPKSGLDDRCLAGGIGPDSRMPVIKPRLHAAPVIPSK